MNEMDESCLTRRDFVKRGAAVSIVVAVGLDAAAVARASTTSDSIPDGVIAGNFLGAPDTNTALVAIPSQGQVSVVMAAGGYLSHGIEGKVSDFGAFVPGELVAVRGPIEDGVLQAVEFQSVYTEAVGTVESDGTAWKLATATGPVSILEDASVRSFSGGFSQLCQGASAAATIWTNPSTGARTATVVEVDA